MKEIFAEEYNKCKNIKYKAIVATYKRLNIPIESKYKMYKKVNELLEDEEVTALIEMYIEEEKISSIVRLEDEILKTNQALWNTYNTASQIENKLTKNGELIEGFYKFQDSNVVTSTLQILARQSDEIRKEILRLRGDKEEGVSDIVTIEWK